MEAALIRQSPKKLDSELLIAGHHGSDTSTSKAFLQAVSPQTVVFSSGFANRYHFPAQAVRQRVIDSGANWRNTACEGALRFHLRPEGVQAEPGWREQSKRWYHNACDDYPSMEPYDPP
jgi:competence protein ComEC